MIIFLDCKYVAYYENMFLHKKKKCISSGVVAISISCGIWEGKNHLIHQIKALYMKRYFKQAARTEVSLSLCCTGMLSRPAQLESELDLKSQVWVMTLSASDHCNCLVRNCLLLINQPCHLIAEFGGTETL